MKILGLETTCDETGVAIVDQGHTILANLIASQIELHSPYGGVFPELASREHVSHLIPLVKQALAEARLLPKEIDAIAVAEKPGLMGSIITGVSVANTLSIAWQKPLFKVNHVHAHLISPLIDLPSATTPTLFPALGIVLSGGHTFFATMHSPSRYEIVSETVDDALGEAFDKVASMLNLPYPGGPLIEKLAQEGDAHRFAFKAGFVKGKPLHFSFSGLKTNVLYTVRELSKKGALSKQDQCDLAASFQHAAFKDIVTKAHKLTGQTRFRSILVGGGVSANKYFAAQLKEHFSHLPTYLPGKNLSTDNGAMIAALAFFDALD